MDSFTEDALNALTGLFSMAGRLKRLKRQGWIDRGVDQPESVADHSWRLALMALVVSRQYGEIDPERAVILALVHDLPEALTGDITPFDDQLNDAELDRDDVFRQTPQYRPQADLDKTDAERQAMNDLTADLPTHLASLLCDAWEEYERADTPEARLVRQLDKLETWLQALEYREIQPELIIESFRKGTERDVTDPELVDLFRSISRRAKP